MNSVTWHEVSKKVDVEPIVNTLNDNIKLAKYGDGLQSISFTYIAVKPTNTLHDNDARFNESDRSLELALQLSYPHVVGAGKQDVLQMMAALFLVSIDLYEKFKIKDFDLDRFREDVESLFRMQGWLQAVH